MLDEFGLLASKILLAFTIQELSNIKKSAGNLDGQDLKKNYG